MTARRGRGEVNLWGLDHRRPRAPTFYVHSESAEGLSDMAGVPGQPSGWNRKSITQHQRDGTYHPYRHAGQRDPEVTLSTPVRPRGLSAAERRMWHHAVESLAAVGPLSPADGPLIVAYVRLAVRAARLSRAASAVRASELVSCAPPVMQQARLADDNAGRAWVRVSREVARRGGAAAAPVDDDDPLEAYDDQITH